MRRLTRLFLAAGVAATAISVAAAKAPTPRDPVLMRGIGTLRIGLPAAALERRFAARPVDRDFEAENDCGYWTSPRLPGLALMVFEGRLARIDVTDPAWRTRSGGRVGMDQQQMLDLYGGLMRVEPHPYTDPEGKYLVYRARHEPFGLIAETSAGKVQSIRVGYWDNVQWIEGCL